MNPKTTGPAPRKKRLVLRWLAAAFVVLIAWQSWRAYDRSLAMTEAQKIGIWVIESGPVQDIRANWKSAFRRETWRMPSRLVKVDSVDELTTHRALLRRLSPTVLTISDASKLTRLSDLPEIETLYGIELWKCRELADLTPHPSLTSLKALGIYNTGTLSDLAPLSKFPNLERLALSDCFNISDLTPLKECRSLKSIFLRDCRNITELKTLAEIPGLQRLLLKYNISIPQSEIDALKAARPDITFE